MQPFRTLEAKAAPMRRENVDTDQIVPARFLKLSRSEGYGKALFRDIRADADGAPRPGFELDAPTLAGAQVLVADRNFGCGSSREAAVYALADGGFRCVIAPSFGDIFRGNAMKNGLLPVLLPRAQVERIWQVLEAEPGVSIVVDLEAQTVVLPDQTSFRFDIDPFAKHCMLNGLDEIGLTLEHEAAIAAYEEREEAEAV